MIQSLVWRLSALPPNQADSPTCTHAPSVRKCILGIRLSHQKSKCWKTSAILKVGFYVSVKCCWTTHITSNTCITLNAMVDLSWCSYLWWVFQLIRIIVVTHPPLQRRPSKNHKTEHLHFFADLGLVQIVWFRPRSSCLGKVVVEWIIKFKRHLTNCHGEAWMMSIFIIHEWHPTQGGGTVQKSMAPHPTHPHPHFCTFLKISAGGKLVWGEGIYLEQMSLIISESLEF